MRKQITYEELIELIEYNPYTGDMWWIKILHYCRLDIKSYRKNILKRKVGYLDKTTGYIRVSINGKKYSVHRLAFLYMNGYFPENMVDHIDRNKLNNKWDNLREVSSSCNVKNRGIQINNKSGITGIYWHKRNNTWEAVIVDNKNRIYLGSHKDFDKAVKARWEAEVKYKFPHCQTTSSAYNYLKENNLL